MMEITEELKNKQYLRMQMTKLFGVVENDIQWGPKVRDVFLYFFPVIQHLSLVIVLSI